MEDKIVIELTVEKTEHVKVFMIGGKMVVGRQEVARVIKAQAQARIDEVLAGLFPANGAGE